MFNQLNRSTFQKFFRETHLSNITLLGKCGSQDYTHVDYIIDKSAQCILMHIHLQWMNRLKESEEKIEVFQGFVFVV